jgi:RimJ/RimL family protein N-acetyltransferase
MTKLQRRSLHRILIDTGGFFYSPLLMHRKGAFMIHSVVQTGAALVRGETDAATFSLLDAETPTDEIDRHLPPLRKLAERAFPNYPYNGFFQDDTFHASLRTGEHLSWVASRGNAVIGHNAIVRDRWALLRDPQNPHHAFEMGRAMVSPSERGRGVGSELARRRHEIVMERYHPVALYSDCATGHDVSTRALLKVGYQPLGLLLGIWDDTFAVGQRESALVMAAIRPQNLSESRPVFIPESAQALARAVYASHGMSRHITTTPTEASLTEETHFFQRQNLAARSAEVFVSQVGADIAGVVQNLIEGGAQSVVVHVKTNSPSVYFAQAQLSALGFIPGLIWPEFGVDENHEPYDVLTLQYLSPEARQGFGAHRIQAPSGTPEEIKDLVLGFL